MLSIGDRFPDTQVHDQDGRPVRLSDYRGRPVILFTFSKAGTAGCTRQACSLREAFPRFDSQGAVVLAMSTDSPAELKAWRERERLPYRLLSDPDGALLSQLGANRMPFLNLKVPLYLHTLWLLDADGVVTYFQVPVGLNEVASAAMKHLAAVPSQA